jgi:hypothetical protein
MGDLFSRRVPRRSFLADTGMGFTGLALGSMLFRDGVARAQDDAAWAAPDGKPMFAPRAKSVIWIFMMGGVSHLESFDPKDALNRYAGKNISETPYKDVLSRADIKDLRRATPQHTPKLKLFPLQAGFKKYGESGLEVSDWWSHVGACADDLAVVRSFYTTDNDHGAQLQHHTGRNAVDGLFPSIGSYVHYGLGSLNDNFPQFVVLGRPIADCCGGVKGHGASWLGPEHAGVRLEVNPENPLAFASPGAGRFREEQKGEFELLERLHRLGSVEFPEDPALRARLRSYELAYRMQSAVPEVMRFDEEDVETRRLYGIDQGPTVPFGRLCLAARRLVEKGVRFVQIFHGGDGAGGSWDNHSGLKAGHGRLAMEADKPIAGLLKDLKRRGLLSDTLVVWGTEFGRSPGGEGSDGRDHHPWGFSGWLAGGGVKGGVVHGATDELGFHPVENRHYITDLHATVLHLMGLEPRRLEIPGRKRLEVDFGKPILEILA